MIKYFAPNNIQNNRYSNLIKMLYIVNLSNSFNDQRFAIGFINAIFAYYHRNDVLFINDIKLIRSLHLKCEDNIMNKLILIDTYAEKLQLILLMKYLMNYEEIFTIRNDILIKVNYENYHIQNIYIYSVFNQGFIKICIILYSNEFYKNYHVALFDSHCIRKAINEYNVFQYSANLTSYYDASCIFQNVDILYSTTILCKMFKTDPSNDICFINDFIYVCTNDPINDVLFHNDAKLLSVDNISNYYSRNKLILLDPYAENLKVVLLVKCLMIYNDTFATRNYILINYHKQDINRYYDCKPRIDNILSLKIIFANFYVSYYYLNFTREAIDRYYTFKHFAYLATNNIHIYDQFKIVLIYQKDFIIYKYDSPCNLNFVQYSKVDKLYVIDVSLIFSNPDPMFTGLHHINKGIIPEVRLVPEAQPKDTNHIVVVFPLATMRHEHIMMTRGKAKGPNFYRFTFFKFAPTVANINWKTVFDIACTQTITLIPNQYLVLRPKFSESKISHQNAYFIANTFLWYAFLQFVHSMITKLQKLTDIIYSHPEIIDIDKVIMNVNKVILYI